MKVSLILNLNISVKCWFTCFCCIKTLKPVQGDRELFVMPNLTFSRFNIVITDKWKRSVFQHLITCVLTKYYINRFFGRCPQNDGRTKSDKTSECELALCRSRLLFFLVSWISFTKTSRSFHYVSTHFCFCNFETTFTSFTSALRKSACFRVYIKDTSLCSV